MTRELKVLAALIITLDLLCGAGILFAKYSCSSMRTKPAVQATQEVSGAGEVAHASILGNLLGN